MQRFIARLVIGVRGMHRGHNVVAVGLRQDMQLTSSRTSCIKVIVNRDVASSSVGVFNSMISMASLVAFVNTNRHPAHRFSLFPPLAFCLFPFALRNQNQRSIEDTGRLFCRFSLCFHTTYKSFFYLLSFFRIIQYNNFFLRRIFRFNEIKQRNHF